MIPGLSSDGSQRRPVRRGSASRDVLSDMDGYGGIVLMTRLATFAEMLFPDVELTRIERDGDHALDRFTCQIYTRSHEYQLATCAGIVSLSAQALDSTASEPTLLAEVEVNDESALETLRACVSAVETISAMKERKSVGGLLTLRKLIDEALAGSHVQVLRFDHVRVSAFAGQSHFRG